MYVLLVPAFIVVSVAVVFTLENASSHLEDHLDVKQSADSTGPIRILASSLRLTLLLHLPQLNTFNHFTISKQLHEEGSVAYSWGGTIVVPP